MPEPQPPRPRRWLTWVFRAVTLAGFGYLALSTGLVIWAVLACRSVTLDELEPPVAELPNQPRLRLDPGTYGPDRPLRAAEFEGKTPTTTINAQGLRNRFDLSPKLGDVVVWLGDPFTFGYGLPDHQTVTHHAGRLDPTRRHVNAAQPLFNLHDSVSRYERIKRLLPRPRAVVIQVLLYNDLLAEKTVEVNFLKRTERLRPWILPPFSADALMARLALVARATVWSDLALDLTAQRFAAHIADALDRLRRAADGVPILVINYDDPAGGMWHQLAEMNRWLARHCSTKGMAMANVSELVGKQVFMNGRLSDFHPNGQLNEALARAVVPRLNRLIAADASP